jgi:hypothetical protein
MFTGHWPGSINVGPGALAMAHPVPDEIFFPCDVTTTELTSFPIGGATEDSGMALCLSNESIGSSNVYLIPWAKGWDRTCEVPGSRPERGAAREHENVSDG